MEKKSVGRALVAVFLIFQMVSAFAIITWIIGGICLGGLLLGLSCQCTGSSCPVPKFQPVQTTCAELCGRLPDVGGSYTESECLIDCSMK